MLINTSDIKKIKPFIEKLNLPRPDSHKGQNGKVLIVGGSSLFHSASIWSAEVASHFADMVHYSSTEENNEIFRSIKGKFRNGIVIAKKDLPSYLAEDDAILLGPGMVRAESKNFKFKISNFKFSDILKIDHESEYTFYLTKYVIHDFPEKKFVFDAGALQMMEVKWLLKLKSKPIITPHQEEFERMFGVSVNQFSVERKAETVQKLAKKYRCIILLKAVQDYISDGKKTYIVEGGNAGLTKGGTGDILAGLTTAFYAKNDPIIAAVLASYVLKRTAEQLFLEKGYWYNNNDLINNVPQVLNKLIFNK